MVYNAGSEQDVQDSINALKFEKTNEQRDINALLLVPEFRRYIWRVLSMTNPMDMSYVPGGLTEDFYFNEGRRNVGVRIIADLIEADPYAYVGLQEENIDVG